MIEALTIVAIVGIFAAGYAAGSTIRATATQRNIADAYGKHWINALEAQLVCDITAGLEPEREFDSNLGG